MFILVAVLKVNGLLPDILSKSVLKDGLLSGSSIGIYWSDFEKGRIKKGIRNGFKINRSRGKDWVIN